jgi:O-antigen/teichoic acid export membrane protein
LAGLAVAETLTALSYTWKFRKYFVAPADGLFSHVRRWLGVALGPAVASVSLLSANWLLQTLLINSVSGPALVGAYGIAQRVAQVGNFLPSAFVSAATPRVLKGGGSNTAFERRVETVTLRAALAGGGATLLASPLLPLLGSDYSLAVLPTAILSVWVVSASGNTLTGQMALARKRTRAWWLSDIGLAILNLAVGLPLLVPLGAIGLSFALLLSTTVSWLALRGYVAHIDRRSDRGGIH